MRPDTQKLKRFLFTAGCVVYDTTFTAETVELGRLSGAKVREHVEDGLVFTDMSWGVAWPEITIVTGIVELAEYQSPDSRQLLWKLSFQGWYNHVEPEVITLWHEALRTAYGRQQFNGGRGMQNHQLSNNHVLWYSNNPQKDSFRIGSGTETIRGEFEERLLDVSYQYIAMHP